VVGFAPGGGYDTFSRILAKYAPKYVPGNPKFVVQNLAGAGGERTFQAI
jgi:tripartite-type tricarboxylate transporter receptor subunit TctC